MQLIPNYPGETKLTDWLSMKQLKMRTGYGRTSLSKAQEKLCKEGYIFITIPDEHTAFHPMVTLGNVKLRQLYGVKYKEKAKFNYSLSSELTNEVRRKLAKDLSK